MLHIIEQNIVYRLSSTQRVPCSCHGGRAIFSINVTFFAAYDVRIELVLPWFTFPGDLRKKRPEDFKFLEYGALDCRPTMAIANAKECSVTAMKDFMAHFRLNDEGEFDLEGDGEGTEHLVLRSACPILDKAIMENGNIRETLDKKRRASGQKSAHGKSTAASNAVGPKGSHRRADQRC
jgi:hypothetical protein